MISAADLRSADPVRKRKVAYAIGQAARDFGFFRICDHGIHPDLIEATYDAARDFFRQPEATKQQYYIANSSNHRGYVPFTEKGDYADEIHRSYEAFDLGLDLPADDSDYLAGNRMLGPNVWPKISGFRRTVTSYYNEVAELGRLVCAALEMYLGLRQGAMTQHMTKPISQLRLLHYVRGSETIDHKSVNMGAHTDYECLTLLHTRNAGLQVLGQDDVWIDVPADPAVLVVNIGDMLEAWSNGFLRSTPHRVLNLSPERYSMPYFVAANHDTVIRPFDELVEPDTAPRYSPFRAGDHLERMLVRDFPYLRAKASSGIGAPTQNPFENRIKKTGP
ncbi:Isopenicillin N synthase [Jannaschia faecimaris]|uniref:2-oxoglutarate-dependent ethylene/succinate-forming enzyme n=1 Tax=Jannaschia faecimaris TaxID=1244108 RepID=A0A1H3U2I6_9RHOB|nr:Isopenicillin N synthase [Jannaschia faecimaris]